MKGVIEVDETGLGTEIVDKRRRLSTVIMVTLGSTSPTNYSRETRVVNHSCGNSI